MEYLNTCIWLIEWLFFFLFQVYFFLLNWFSLLFFHFQTVFDFFFFLEKISIIFRSIDLDNNIHKSSLFQSIQSEFYWIFHEHIFKIFNKIHSEIHITNCEYLYVNQFKKLTVNLRKIFWFLIFNLIFDMHIFLCTWLIQANIILYQTFN